MGVFSLAIYQPLGWSKGIDEGLGCSDFFRALKCHCIELLSGKQKAD